ncbi:MAG TPA: hypothetical protein PL109_12250, partial [Nitrospira sp.]|nr:hypothetical protein [Nitrospira sp.]
ILPYVIPFVVLFVVVLGVAVAAACVMRLIQMIIPFDQRQFFLASHLESMTKHRRQGGWRFKTC